MDTASRKQTSTPPAGFSGSLPPGGGLHGANGGGAQDEASVLAPFERLFATLKRMAGNYATLAVLDVRRSAVQLAWLIAGGILISVLVVTAWLAGVVALAAWLLRDGMPLPAVLLVAAGVNLFGALLVGLRIRSIFDHVPFSATLHQIKADEPAKLDADIQGAKK
jgi:uncharacterized membrane protein YqjE